MMIFQGDAKGHFDAFFLERFGSTGLGTRSMRALLRSRSTQAFAVMMFSDGRLPEVRP
ncbi:hypothetical protein D3C80_2115110 [compost metagenome]